MLNLLEEIKNNQNIRTTDFILIQKAIDFSQQAHSGQKRASGEEYFIHPLNVASILNSWNLDSQTIVAGLLHDVVDDCQVPLALIEKEFGKEVKFLVESMSGLGLIKYRGIERTVENFRRLFVSTAKDGRVIFIKLADRLHNMRTLKYLPENKQKRIAKETLEIYVAIASRLGIGQVKSELEDLAAKYIYSQEHQWLMENLPSRIKERLDYLKKIKPIIEDELNKAGIKNYKLDFRAKGYYSSYKKLLKCSMNFEEIYDLAAFRIIVEDVSQCYQILGLIHKLWKPLSGRIKDYIALPKSNGYQSLHTTVFSLDGQIIEFQIRTFKMHEECQLGIAAHWAYSENGQLNNETRFKNSKFDWVRQLSQQFSNAYKNQDFLESLRIDYFNNRIFIFTPKGDIIDLPQGATPIDFAYQIHSDIGNHCVGVKINGKISKISKELANNDKVEIITQKNKKPSSDWLKFVKTTDARSRIKQALGIS
ncbi:bifunctional (p)ppGpp synthetase/guanosine-3',5'-bis(diphosphate) 3'-pyrophosphohydrolase [Candidatus Azambacteria bacterium]|nr:bifunctional (p)ppGpp synthetase/guanosine-3',5'-bis(diphosphate) 3'-pyrophosphohydrolase [Candidatus Azambacteria bacterium]